MDDAIPTETDETFDPTRRKLCPDGTCVGVIGDDGLCRVCGRSEAEAEAGAPVADRGDTDDVRPFDSTAPTSPGAAEHGIDPGTFDSTRRLCDDGSCVGVVGEDGVCRVCGRRSE
jgi:hypothetical protein